MVTLSPAHQRILERLIEMAAADQLHGAYSDIPIEVYHHPACPGISSTTVKAIVARSLAYAQVTEFKRTPEMELGSAFHDWMQGPEYFYRKYSVGKFGDDKQHLSFQDFGTVQLMAKKTFAHPEAFALIDKGDPEKTFFSRCPITGVLRKCRPDVIKEECISDYKSTFDASPIGFARTARRLLYRISAVYYPSVVNDALGVQRIKDFRLIAVESEGLHEVGVYPVDERSLERAESEIVCALRAIQAQQQGGWIGYGLYQDPISI